MGRLPSGNVTFCFTDIEGSTQLFAKLGPRFLDLLEQHRHIIRAAVTAHGGAEVKTEGDGFFLAFGDPARALHAAVDFQRAIATHTWPDEGTIRVRAGLHSGIAEPTEDDDYMTLAVHEAARIASAGHGGQTLLSDVVRARVDDALPDGASLRDIGYHELRDVGRLRLHQVCHPELPETFPPLRAAGALRGYVPAPTSSWIGRDDDVAALHDRLRTARLVTITGAGGIGKTRLATEVARRALGMREDGIWFVDLARLTDAGRLADTVLVSVGAVRDATVEARTQLLDHLRQRDVLLVVDNCEHVVDVASELVHDLLRACSRITVLATSREPLGIEGEMTVRLRSLHPDESSALFLDRAHLVRPDLVVTDAVRETVTNIVQRLDGIPLAIELAAARVRVLQPAQILERLDDRFSLLTGGSRTALARQRTLEAAVDWSYDLLDDDEKRLLRRVSVFVGGFQVDAAEALWSADVIDVLERLVDKSMVVASLYADEIRYRMLETIRHYGWTKLLESGEVADVRDGHARHFAERLGELAEGLFDERETESAERIGIEEDNARSALEWTTSRGSWAIAGDLVASMWLYWALKGRMAEALTWIDLVLEHADELDPERVAEIHLGAAWSHHLNGSSSDVVCAYAQRVLDHARARSTAEPARWYDAWALVTLGLRSGEAQGDPTRFEEAIPLARSSGNGLVLVEAVLGRAMTAASDARRESFIAKLQEAVDVATESRCWSSRAYTLHALASALAEAGHLDRACAIAEDAVAAGRRNPNVWFLLMALMSRGNAKLYRGDPDAELPWLEARDLARAAGIEHLEVHCLLALGQLHIARRESSRARDYVERADEIRRPDDHHLAGPLVLGRIRTALAEVAQLEGDVEAPREIYEQLLVAAEASAVDWVVGSVRNSLGWLAQQAGNVEAAERHHLAALNQRGGIAIPNRDAQQRAAALRGLAGVALIRGDAAGCARLSGAASSVAEPNSAVATLCTEYHRDAMEAARRALGDAAFDRHFEEGAAIGLDALSSSLAP